MPKPLSIDQLIANVGIKDGYKRLMWADAKDGDEVYVWGQHGGKPQAYGPHTIHSVAERRILNRKLKSTFMDYSEDLLVKIAEDLPVATTSQQNADSDKEQR